MSTETPKDTPRERRKKKAQQAIENRNKPVAESTGKNTPANSFVPESEDPAPPSPTATPTSSAPSAETVMPTAVKSDEQTPYVDPKTTPLPKVKEPKGRTVSTGNSEKTPTLFDMLAGQKKTVEKEQTDAALMQKYYALSDAFNALGKMGGAAIGGAIGGNMMDSAPIVGEYKENRGYITAFEKAKQANARLRELDNMQYQLAVRDEERSYKQQVDKLNREYQKQLIDYKNQVDRANADRDYERSKELKMAIAEMEQKHKKEIAELNNKYEQENLKLKNQYRQSEQAGSRANMQYQHDLYNSVPLAFNDGTGIRMSKNDYEGLLRFFNGKKIGNVTVNKDNIDTFLRDNPKLVNDYITAVGGASVAGTTKTKDVNNTESTKTDEPTSFLGFSIPYNGLDAYSQFSKPYNLVEVNPEDGINKEDFKNTFASLKQ